MPSTSGLEAVGDPAGHEDLDTRVRALTVSDDTVASVELRAQVDVGAERLAGDDGDELGHRLGVQPAHRAAARLGDVDLDERLERPEVRRRRTPTAGRTRAPCRGRR